MIIDTHTHFYDPERSQGVPWPDPDDNLLYRRVLPEDYKALAVPKGITGTVVVEASTWVEDNGWILDLAEKESFIVGFVGNLNPEGEDFKDNLTRFTSNPLFRGIRVRGMDIQNLNRGEVSSNLKLLAENDLEVDLLVDFEDLDGVTLLAGEIPDLRIAINHIAHVPIDGEAPDPSWMGGMKKAAHYPNVYCKVSGLVERAQQNPAPEDPEYYFPTLDVLWEAFGEDRLFYGSNWPVCEKAGDYATVQHIVKEYFKSKGEEATEKYFWKNSKVVYKWLDRS